MKNRAKCKLCGTVIESFHASDYVECKCGEISVSEGESMRCAANNWDNFLRIDDLGNEIMIKVKKEKEITIPEKITKSDLVKVLEDMVSNIEGLPKEAMLSPITHYDYCSLLILLSSIFRIDCKDPN